MTDFRLLRLALWIPIVREFARLWAKMLYWNIHNAYYYPPNQVRANPAADEAMEAKMQALEQIADYHGFQYF